MINPNVISFYSDRYLESLSVVAKGAEVRAYLGERLVKRKKGFRSLIEFEDWMAMEVLKYPRN